MRFPTDKLIAKSSLLDFGLSRNKSLRTFEVTARSIISRRKPRAPNPTTLRFLRTVLSTIASPSFVEVVIIYLSYDFGGVVFHCRPRVCKDVTPAEREKEASWHRGLFKVFRKMYAIRDFQLVLCVDVWDCVGEHAKGLLKEAVAVEKAKNGFDYLPLEPLVVYSPRRW